MRLPTVVVALALALSAPVAFAQDAPPEVQGIKIAVPKARGKRAWGVAKLTKRLRRDIAAATGAMVSPKAFSRAQRKLRHRGRSKNDPDKLAAAGARSGAHYVLSVDVSKKKWVYTAHAILINTATGEIQMDFRSGYYKPSKEAADRGERIARTTLGKIAKLIGDGDGPRGLVASAPQPPKEDPFARRAETPTPREDPFAQRVEAPPPPPKEDPFARRVEPPPPPQADPFAPKADAPRSGDRDASTDASRPREDATPASDAFADTTAATESKPAMMDKPTGAGDVDGSSSTSVAGGASGDEQDFLWFSLTAGSGLLHTYELSSAAVASSGLSYRLAPIALFAADAEFVIPGVGVGIFADFGLSPMELDVQVDNAQVAAPKGSLLNLGFGANLHIALSGSGRAAYEVIPRLGLRLNSMSVDRQPANIVLSNSSVTPFVGVAVRLPLNEMLDLAVGVDGGLVVSYSEDPETTAVGGGSGFAFGGWANARFWITDLVGLALDTSFDLQSIGLDGAPTRQVPPNEDLTNPTVSTRDLRVSLGVALRI